MFHAVYLLWALLPLVLFGLWLWALLKPVFGVAGKEDGAFYFKQAMFCTMAFGLAVIVDNYFLESMLDYLAGLGMGEDAAMIAHWLLYPALLLLLAKSSQWYQIFSGKDPKKEIAYGMGRYQR